jgi:hypothetical protein
MFAFTSRGFRRTAILAGLALAGIGTFLTAGVEPAQALCNYNGPHCITNDPSIGPKKPGNPGLPGTGWVDPDCLKFGNCNSSELKGTEVRRPTSGQRNAVLENNGRKTR